MYVRMMLIGIGIILAPLTLFADEPPRYWDYNGDGKEDIWYEYKPMNYLEYLDRNFDGKADFVTQLDSRTDWPLSSNADENFDGIFESKYVYQKAQLFAIISDSDNNQCFDTVHYFRDQLIVESKKFETIKGRNQITTITYDSFFPLSPSVKESEQSCADFHREAFASIPSSQKMPLKKSN